MKILCPYCGKPAKLVDSAIVYNGRSYGPIWDCRPCDAYVGVHKGTTNPLGRMANKELREWKVKAHAKFDPLWKSMGIPRRHAYNYLRLVMGMTPDQGHIGKFDVSDCKKLIECLDAEIYQ